jgi:hypothetical protein
VNRQKETPRMTDKCPVCNTDIQKPTPSFVDGGAREPFSCRRCGDRSLRAFGLSSAQRPGTLSPDPWHLTLCASSMVQEQGDAAPRTTSPMPLDCCGARGACQQSPTLRSSDSRLSAAVAIGKGANRASCHSSCHAIGPKRQMPGVWGQSPQESTSTQRPDEPNVRRAGRMPSSCQLCRIGAMRYRT